MKLTNAEIKNMFDKDNPNDPSSKSAIETLYSMDIPIKTAYKFKKSITKLEKEAAIIEEMRTKLIKKYATKVDGKEPKEGRMSVAPDKIEEFQKEFAKILEKETEIDFEPISISQIADSKISAKVLALVDKLICE